MSQIKAQNRDATVEDLYAEAEHWHVNTGGETIHAKRMSGRWRTVKWLANAAWIIFFLGPYLRWGDRQAVLFDIPHRQFHIFNATILVLGGGVSQSYDLFVETLQEALKTHVMIPNYLDDFSIAIAELGDDVGLMGALALAREATN